jgi:hypothetical protein
MNERINQLANEAGLQPFEDCGPKYVYKMEKFAELIVRECIHKIETYEIYVGASAAGEIACEMTYSALKQIRDEIKETFGVE